MKLENIIVQTIIGIFDKLQELEKNPIALYVITSALIFSFIIATGVILLYTYLSDNDITKNYEMVNEEYRNEIREISAPLQRPFDYPNNMHDFRKHIISISQSTNGEFEYFNPDEEVPRYSNIYKDFDSSMD